MIFRSVPDAESNQNAKSKEVVATTQQLRNFDIQSLTPHQPKFQAIFTHYTLI